VGQAAIVVQAAVAEMVNSESTPTREINRSKPFPQETLADVVLAPSFGFRHATMQDIFDFSQLYLKHFNSMKEAIVSCSGTA
jgi:hypothetical protein